MDKILKRTPEEQAKIAQSRQDAADREAEKADVAREAEAEAQKAATDREAAELEARKAHVRAAFEKPAFQNNLGKVTTSADLLSSNTPDLKSAKGAALNALEGLRNALAIDKSGNQDGIVSPEDFRRQAQLVLDAPSYAEPLGPTQPLSEEERSAGDIPAGFEPKITTAAPDKPLTEEDLNGIEQQRAEIAKARMDHRINQVINRPDFESQPIPTHPAPNETQIDVKSQQLYAKFARPYSEEQIPEALNIDQIALQLATSLKQNHPAEFDAALEEIEKPKVEAGASSPSQSPTELLSQVATHMADKSR